MLLKTDEMVPGDRVPSKIPPVIIPVTVKLFKVPNDVIFGCAAFTIVPFIVVAVKGPLTVSELMLLKTDEIVPGDSVPSKIPPVIIPVTVKLFKVPNDVIFG